MSVAKLSKDELGLFAAIATHLKLAEFTECVRAAELIGESNCSAFNAQYNEAEQAATAVEIELVALRRLSQKQLTTQGAFGPFIYNTVTNDGARYVGGLELSDSMPGLPRSGPRS